MKLITQQIYQGQTRQVQQDLNSILTNWKFNNQPIKSAQEFINKLEPWINARIKDQEELEKFLKKKGVKSLKDLE